MTPIDQPTASTFRTRLYHFVTGLLLGALAFSFAWTSGLAQDALRFMMVILAALFVLRYMTPLNKINWWVVVGVVVGIVLVIVRSNLSLASLGTAQLALVLGMLWLMR